MPRPSHDPNAADVEVDAELDVMAAELAAMKAVARILKPLSDRGRVRVVAYFADRFLEHVGFTAAIDDSEHPVTEEEELTK